MGPVGGDEPPRDGRSRWRLVIGHLFHLVDSLHGSDPWRTSGASLEKDRILRIYSMCSFLVDSYSEGHRRGGRLNTIGQ